MVENEISILLGLSHDHIYKIQGYGSDGAIVKPSGREITNLVFLVLEYVPGGLFFDTCETAGAMGEDAGRYFMSQLVDVLSYLHTEKQVAHRDLKLDNILIGDDLNLVLADFGYACFGGISRLSSYRGSRTYMAPEIKEEKIYDGREVDIFALGVILFVIVVGTFPFTEARKDE